MKITPACCSPACAQLRNADCLSAVRRNVIATAARVKSIAALPRVDFVRIDLTPQLTYEDFRGAPGRIRTCDARFRKPMLYPLSYEGDGASL